MRVEKTINKEAVVITFPEGYVGSALVENLKEISVSDLERDTLIVDLSRATHLGSLVFGWLSRVYKTLKKQDKNAIIISNDNIHELLDQVGLSRLFKIVK